MFGGLILVSVYDSQNGFVDGNLLVFETESEEYGITYESAVKIDWKTGWLNSMFSKNSNATDTIYEQKIAVKPAGGVPGFESVPILLGIFVIRLVDILRFWIL